MCFWYKSVKTLKGNNCEKREHSHSEIAKANCVEWHPHFIVSICFTNLLLPCQGARLVSYDDEVADEDEGEGEKETKVMC